MTRRDEHRAGEPQRGEQVGRDPCGKARAEPVEQAALAARQDILLNADRRLGDGFELAHVDPLLPAVTKVPAACHRAVIEAKSCRSEEHTSELQSLMRITYAVFCLKKKHK